MTLLVLNLLLAVLWMLLWNSVDLYTLLVGLVGGYLVLWVFTRVLRRGVLRDAYGQRVVDLVRFAGYFCVLLWKSNVTVAWEIVTPGFHMRPRIVRYDVGHLNDVQVVALSNAITLTPGTLVIDISPDKHFLYIHCMYAQDRTAAIRELDDLRLRMEHDVFRLQDARPDPAAAVR